jgi:hypothetical protein
VVAATAKIIGKINFGNGAGTPLLVHDWFGHGTDDFCIHTSSTRTWEFYCPLTGESETITFGHTDPSIPVWGKFDGVRTQIASFKDGIWWIKDHDALTYVTVYYGTTDDIPLSSADFDGDGKSDIAVYRPTGIWYWKRSSDNVDDSAFWGASGDIALPFDFTGDNSTDVVVWRPSNGGWYLSPSTTLTMLGLPGDIPVPGDFNGDGSVQPAVFRPSTQEWYLDSSTATHTFGLSTSKPFVGDFNGLGIDRICVFDNVSGEGVWTVYGNAPTTTWYIKTASGFELADFSILGISSGSSDGLGIGPLGTTPLGQ